MLCPMATDEPPDNVRKLPAPVAELRPKETALYSVSIKREAEPCAHHKSLVDDIARTVKCAKCGAPLDPFDRLFKLALEHDRRVSDAKHSRAELAALQKRIEMLERIESNARARLRRLGVPRLEDWRLDQLIRKEEKT